MSSFVRCATCLSPLHMEIHAETFSGYDCVFFFFNDLAGFTLYISHHAMF